MVDLRQFTAGLLVTYGFRLVLAIAIAILILLCPSSLKRPCSSIQPSHPRIILLSFRARKCSVLLALKRQHQLSTVSSSCCATTRNLHVSKPASTPVFAIFRASRAHTCLCVSIPRSAAKDMWSTVHAARRNSDLSGRCEPSPLSRLRSAPAACRVQITLVQQSYNLGSIETVSHEHNIINIDLSGTGHSSASRITREAYRWLVLQVHNKREKLWWC